MMVTRRDRPTPIAFVLLILLCLGGFSLLNAQSAGDETSTLIPDSGNRMSEIDRMRLNWDLQGIRTALENGFVSVADTLTTRLLQRDDLDEAVVTRLLNDRLRVSLLMNRMDAARAAVLELSRKNAATDPVMEAFFHYFEGNSARLEEVRSAINIASLNEEQLAWSRLLDALILDREGDIESANAAFDMAEAIAPTDLLQDQFEIIRFREDLLRGESDEVMISALRESVRSMSGERGGFEAARLLAIALHQNGENSEAIEVLNEQISKPGLRELQLRSEFLLLLGTIAGADSSRGKLALREVIEDQTESGLQAQALTLLAQAIQGNLARDQFIANLDSWLNSPNPHPLADRFLAFRAFFHAEAGEFDFAAQSAETLLQRYPNSSFVPNALRLLAYVSWNQRPPRYRTAADYLNRLRQAYPGRADSIEVGILIADCYFLNGDYSNASDVYGAVSIDAPDSVVSDLFYQRVLSEIRIGQLDSAEQLIDLARGNQKISVETIWRAEWNLLDHMRRNNRVDRAYQRITEALSGSPGSIGEVSPSLDLRFRWLEARLTLEAGPVTEAIEKAQDLLDQIRQSGPEISSSLLEELESHLLLLKGEAQMASGSTQDGIATFTQLRERFPDAGPTILSYLVESRSGAAEDNLVGAQQSLIGLVDQFPQSEYAPIALWEAALSAEQRGLNSYLQESITILERLVTSYPDHELVYYARLKQGDLARRLNDFPTALLLYERLLSQYQNHPERYRAELSRADCLMALGSENTDRFDQAAVVYERNCLLPIAPFAIRVEAGFKWAHALRQQNDADGAEAVYWLVIDRFVNDPDLSQPVLNSQSGRYWLSRVLLELGAIQLAKGETATAIQVYQQLLEMNLPGSALAQARLELLQ